MDKHTKTFHRNGPSIIITKIKKVTKSNLYEKGNILNYLMDKKRSIDIDNLKDFSRAKRVLSKKLKKNILIIGSGNIGLRHIQSIINNKNINKIYVYDIKVSIQ